MPKWTNEQLDAINKSGTNIIVSAGAGSGKTAVLTERVIEKLKMGIKINELLILTFTNAAAEEMKERIRKKISEHEELLENLDYLDLAYITTFDSYTLALVKKYNYLLNVSSNLNIVDAGIIKIKKEEILDKVFDKFYLKNDDNFNKLINDFTIKNDNSLKESILNIINSLELVIDKDEYLNNYIENNFNELVIDNYIKEFNNLIRNEIESITTNLMFIKESDFSKYSEDMEKSLEKLLKSITYDEIKMNIPLSLPRRPKNSEDIKEFKDNIDESLKTIKEYIRFENTDEIKEIFNITKNYLEAIIAIIKEFNNCLEEYKKNNDLYEFTDIELMAIKLLKENSNVKDEIKKSIKEICVDEYQDTNDLQETFINLIQNNNVYMVGDIKQSIYGFRNANPSIFKEKYDNYANNNGGLKIDLLKNFRSREEVLDGINEIFKRVMDDTIGGADYVKSHQMVFGNTSYLENRCNSQNYNLEILNYNFDNEIYSQEEIEIFIIARDILNKINNKYQVIDKETSKLRDVKYSDFCIIMDRGITFPLYKKIFEYLGIPLTIYEDKKLNSEIDIMLISNIFSLILKVKDNIIDKDFKYLFMSIARSYLFELSDNKIFKIIKDNNYENTDIYKICKNISNNLDSLNSYELLNIILNEFKVYENTIKIGNIEDTIIRIDNLKDLTKNLSSIGYTIYDFKDYLDKMLNSKMEITYKMTNTNSDSVKIMNIHKSKGLEFPICYYSGLYKEFNTMDIKNRFTYDKKYGIITPFFKEGIGTTILKDLLKNKYNIENVSEKLRLFYVALTRSKEKIIIISPKSLNKIYSEKVDFNIKRKYKSFLSILNSISGNLDKYTKNINIDQLNISKDYMYNNKNIEIINKDTSKIIYKKLNISNTIVNNKKASKEIHELITTNEREVLDYGILMHKVFETTDFLNIDKNNPYYEKISKFVNKLNINKNTLIYKEHEFMFTDEDITYHGIIDLVLIDDNEIKIVDYKLKNIDDPKYKEQLNIYYKYLTTIFNKNIKLYLYSIINDELKELK